MFKIDLSQKNAAISVIFTMDVVFFCCWILLGLPGRHPEMDDKLWTLFFAANQALFLILNTEAKKDAGIPDNPPPNPPPPADPAKPQ